MLIVDILAAAGAAAPQNKFGFMEALKQGGFIAVATVVILGIMSFGSFYILFTKWFEQSKILRQYNVIRTSFWRAPTLREGVSKLDRNSAWRQLVDDGIQAEDQHAKMTDSLEAHDWLHGSLARSEASINARLASGLPFLATVGATSPFIGLFGTVIGIMTSFQAIAGSKSTNLAVVAPGIAEALLATAIGLVAAIPAVIAYNRFMGEAGKLSSRMEGFADEFSAILSRQIDEKLQPRQAAQ